jgi:hypothetical protein
MKTSPKKSTLVVTLFSLVAASTVVLGGCAATVEEGADQATASSEEPEGEVGTSEDALGPGCIPCPAGTSCITPGTCIKRVAVAGPCISGQNWHRTVSANPESYGTDEFTAWIGGGDSLLCSRKEIRRSWDTIFITGNCASGHMYETYWSGHRVKKERGISSGVFGMSHTCGLFLTYGPWGGWKAY